MSASPSLNRGTYVCISKSVYVRTFGTELVLLDFGRGEYFGLDAIGAEIWGGLDRGESLGAIADKLVERYEISAEEAFSDVAQLVSSMADASLVSVPG